MKESRLLQFIVYRLYNFDITESRTQTKMNCCKSPDPHLRVLPTILGSQSEMEEAWDDEAENRGDKEIGCPLTFRCPPTEIVKLSKAYPFLDVLHTKCGVLRLREQSIAHLKVFVIIPRILI